jgi:predicted GH43/DUF377 family glycosyl hydrolase
MPKTYVQLGRLGDILCLLPLLYQDSLKGERPRLVVAREYASVLEGCSYVEPVVYEGPHYEIAKACQSVEEHQCTQVNGPVEQVRDYTYKPAGLEHAVTTSFVKEMWRVAGRLNEWDQVHPLVFNNRDEAREKDLLRSAGLVRRGKQKPLMLVALEGNSSKFKHAELLLELIQGRFGSTWNIMPLPKAERFYDLLALYQTARLLISIDSAPLHLARATPDLPVVALVNDTPALWNGSPWMPNHIFYCRYGDFADRAKLMLSAIDHGMTISRDVQWVFNAVEEGENYGPHLFPIVAGMGGRDATMIGDKKRYPFLKDCLRMALQRSRGGFICLTRPRVKLVDGVIEHDLCYAYRIENGTYSPVVDFFSAPRQWWADRLEDIPHFIFGTDHNWSHVLLQIFKQHQAVDITGKVFREPSPTPQKYDLFAPRHKHNKELCESYVISRKVYSRYPKASQQVEVVANFTKMLRSAYNPSSIEWQGKLLMACRFHPTESLATKLMMVSLNADYTIESSQLIELPGSSAEDPRLFVKDGKLHMSYVDAVWPTTARSLVRYGYFEYESFHHLGAPDLPGNDGSTMQKNWVFWDTYCQVSCQPYVIYDLTTKERFESEQPKWAFGTIRGGTRPVPYEGKLLRFFHGNLDNEIGLPIHRRRYFMGAMLVEPTPPFACVRTSARPILYGSEIDDLKLKERPHHWKQNVVFPCGVIERDGHWVVSVGVNDSACLLVKITPDKLNL